jgi:RHS repeat-associated protein
MPSTINGTWFMYDGLGERLRKVTGSSTSIYPLGDDYEITNGVVTKYISVDGLGVIAKRVGTSPNIVSFWLHTDRLGSIQAVTDLSGNELQRRTYLPYGDKIADTTAHTESRGWIDQRTDGETRLTYLHARYYDPELGLFVSPDPAEDDANAYAYSFGDPVNGADPTGLYQEPDNDNPTPDGGGDGFPWFIFTNPNTPEKQAAVAGAGGGIFWLFEKAGRSIGHFFGFYGNGAASSQGAGPVSDEAEFAGRPVRTPHHTPSTAAPGTPGTPVAPPVPPVPPAPPGTPPGGGHPHPGPAGGGVDAVLAVVGPRLGAFWDGAIPIPNYYPNRLLWVNCPECSASFTTGKWTRDVELALAGGLGGPSAAARAGAFPTALGKQGWLLGRGGRGLLNSNDFLRFGWGWQGSARAGRDVIRVAIGSKRLPRHWHMETWPLW